MRRDKLISLLVDDVLSGEVLKFGSRELSAYRLIDDESVEMWVAPDDLAGLLTDDGYARDRIRRYLAEKARAWLETNPHLVDERLQSIEDEEREAA